jgi:MoxR-like ATPase
MPLAIAIACDRSTVSSATRGVPPKMSASIFDSADSTHDALVAVGYLTTREVSTNIFLAANENQPLLLEGPAGAGKTELAVSVAKAAGFRLIRLQCYEGISSGQAIGDYNQALQNMYIHYQERNQTSSWEEIQKEIKGRAFFMAGPLLEAIESPERVVLLIDELDKVGYAFEAVLLEMLSVWQLSVPQLGLVTATHPPFTVITSNEERVLGFPVRRRIAYLPIEHPTPQTEAAIVARRTPDASPELHLFIAGFAEALRAQTWQKPPSISEMITLAVALQRLGRNSLSAEDKDLLLPLIAKTGEDRKKMLIKNGFEILIGTAWKNVRLNKAKAIAERSSQGEITSGDSGSLSSNVCSQRSEPTVTTGAVA